MIDKLKQLFISQPYLMFSSALITLLCIIFLFTNYTPILGIIAVLIGTIFPALKYRLDSYHYNLKLFDDRRLVFEKLESLINQIHQDYGSSPKVDFFLNQFDKEIYSTGRFIFKRNTLSFLNQFRNNLIDLYNKDAYKNRRDEIDSFFGEVKVRGKLTEHFPELMLSLF